MNTNTKNLSICIIFSIFIVLLAGIGCTNKDKMPVLAYTPSRIITDFSDMQEHEIVSRAWIRRGFVLSNCRTITLEPVTDLSQIPQPKAVKRFEEGLRKMKQGQLVAEQGPAERLAGHAGNGLSRHEAAQIDKAGNLFTCAPRGLKHIFHACGIIPVKNRLLAGPGIVRGINNQRPYILVY